MPGASDGGRHFVASSRPKGKRHQHKEAPGTQTKGSVQASTTRRPDGLFSGDAAGHWHQQRSRFDLLLAQLVRHCCIPFASPYVSPPSVSEGRYRRYALLYLSDGSPVLTALDSCGPTECVSQRSIKYNPSRVDCWDARESKKEAGK